MEWGEESNQFEMSLIWTTSSHGGLKQKNLSLAFYAPPVKQPKVRATAKIFSDSTDIRQIYAVA